LKIEIISAAAAATAAGRIVGMRRIVIISNPHKINYDLIHNLRILFPECVIEIAPVSPGSSKDAAPTGNRGFASREQTTSD
jgi:hypothetical protein